MWDLCSLIWWAFVGRFRSTGALEAEILVLRQQINVLRRTAPKRPRFGSIDRLIFVGLYRLFPNVGDALGHPQTRHCDPLASCRVQSLLAHEIGASRRKAEGVAGVAPVDPRHEPGEPAVGRTAYPRRTSQAWHRYRADERGQVYGAQEATTDPGLEDVSEQPCRWHRCDEPVRRCHDFVPAALWLGDPAPRSTPHLVHGGDSPPDRRVDRPPAY